jgi:hypothetical protein
MRLAEGHAMTDTAMVPRKSEGREPARPALIDEQLADQLLGKAQAEGVELLGPDGLGEVAAIEATLAAAAQKLQAMRDLTARPASTSIHVGMPDIRPSAGRQSPGS